MNRAVIIVLVAITSCGGVMAQASLKKYREKRNFERTAEPRGTKKTTSKKPIFVVQQHDASHMHYDVRLEIGGVLVSWAVPKGPSLNPAIKRLAVRTEDHPMAYANFEGTIPQGEYGGGAVMVWDTGTFTNIKEKNGKVVPLKQCLKNGQIEVVLEGEKLQGAFALIKTHFSEKEQWLLIKMHDEYASARKNPMTTQKKSALTDRTLSQIAKDEAAQEEQPKKSKKTAQVNHETKRKQKN